MRNILLILTLTILVSCQTTSKSADPIKADKLYHRLLMR